MTELAAIYEAVQRIDIDWKQERRYVILTGSLSASNIINEYVLKWFNNGKAIKTHKHLSLIVKIRKIIDSR